MDSVRSDAEYANDKHKTDEIGDLAQGCFALPKPRFPDFSRFSSIKQITIQEIVGNILFKGT